MTKKGRNNYSFRSSTLRQRRVKKNSIAEEKLQLRQSPRLKEERRIAALEKCNQAWLDRQAADDALKEERRIAAYEKFNKAWLDRQAADDALNRKQRKLASWEARQKQRLYRVAKERRRVLEHLLNNLTQQGTLYAAFKHAANEGDTVDMAKLWRQLHTTVRLHYVNYEVNNTWVESDQFKQMCALLRSAPTGTY